MKLNLINELKEKYKDYDVSIFLSDQVKEETIPKCEIIYDCFLAGTVFRTEIIKTWILNAFTAYGLYKSYRTRELYGVATLLNYDITSNSRKSLNYIGEKFRTFINQNTTIQYWNKQLQDIIKNYIDKDLFDNYDDCGQIRIIFHRRLQDYARILDFNEFNEENMKSRIDVMNKQIKYLGKADLNSGIVVKTIMDDFDLTIKNVTDTVKKSFYSVWTSLTDFFKLKNTEIEEDLKSDFISYDLSNDILIIKVRNDTVSFDLIEYLKLCSKNYNYNVKIKDKATIDFNTTERISIYNTDNFYTRFLLILTKTKPYVYIDDIKNDNIVVLKNAADNTTKNNHCLIFSKI